MDSYPTASTAVHVCLHGQNSDGKATVGSIGTLDRPLIVQDVSLPPVSSLTLSNIDSLALAVSALADVSAIATAANELTASEKNQLRAIFAARIRKLMPLV